MTLITLKDLSVTLGAPLFEDLSLTLNPGDRLGLVAANGRGKSTLLRTIAGLAEPTASDITRARGLRVALVAQDIPADLTPLPLRDAVLTGLAPDEADYESWRADIALDDLEIPEDLRERPLGQLSGGWQRAAMLARAWVGEPDVLLLDEPTNHLDLSRIGKLERWIGALPRDFPLIVASHDRAFLDAVTNRTLFLRAERSAVFALSYSAARAALDEADAAQARQAKNDLSKANQLRRQAAKLKNIGINSGSDLLVNKTKQLTERAEKIEQAVRPAHQEKSAGAIRLAHAGTHAKALVTIDTATISTPDGRALYSTGRLWISPGDRVVLLGANGSGKSQMIRAVHRAAQGEVVDGIGCAAALRLGHSDQELAQLAGAATPAEAIAGAFDVGDARARSLLAGAGIGIDLQSAPVAALSGGQKARLAMLVLRLTAPNFYLLDEPTNHLDIEGQEALEQELSADEASCLLVSHDRSFVRAVGTRFWEIRGRRLIEVEGPEAFFAGAVGG